MITTRPHGRPSGGLLARIQRRLTPRWQTVAQIAGDDMVGDVARALSTLERDGLAEREGQRWRAPQPPEQLPPERVVTWGCGELAELLSSAIEALLDEEEAERAASDALRDLAEYRGRRIEDLEAELRKDRAGELEMELMEARGAARVALRKEALALAELAETRAAFEVLDLVLDPTERGLSAAARAGIVVGQLQILRARP